jgi:DNA ligase (NAD+)
MREISFSEIKPFVRYARYLDKDMYLNVNSVKAYDARLLYCCKGTGKIYVDGSELENLNFVAYDVQETGYKTITGEEQKMLWLIHQGFEVPAWRKISTLEEALAFRTESYLCRDDLEYDIDGVVVKPEVIDYEDLKNRTPKNSCAIKFELDVAVTTIIGFDWSQSGKYFSPVAILEPVELCGVTVKRASCSNTKWLAERGIEIGSKVRVVRRGEIIPHIEGLADEN